MNEKSKMVLKEEENKSKLPTQIDSANDTKHNHFNMIQPLVPASQIQPTFLIPTFPNSLFFINDNSLAGKNVSSIQLPIMHFQNTNFTSTSLTISSPSTKNSSLIHSPKIISSPILTVVQPKSNQTEKSPKTALKNDENAKNLSPPIYLAAVQSNEDNKNQINKQDINEINFKSKKPSSLLETKQVNHSLLSTAKTNSKDQALTPSNLKLKNIADEKFLTQIPKDRSKKCLPTSSSKLRVIGASRKLQPFDQKILQDCFDSLRDLLNRKAKKMKELKDKCIQMGKIEYTITIEGSKVDVNLITSHINHYQKLIENDFRRMELAVNAMEKLFQQVNLKYRGQGIEIPFKNTMDINRLTARSESQINSLSSLKRESFLADSLKNKFICNFCNKIFLKPNLLSTHVELEHKNSYPSPERKRHKHLFNEKCDVCGRKFHSIIMLSIHKATFHSQRVTYKGGSEAVTPSSPINEEEPLVDHNYSKAKTLPKKSSRISRPSERFSPPTRDLMPRPRGRPKMRPGRPGRPREIQNNVKNKVDSKVIKKLPIRAVSLPCVPYVSMPRESYRESLIRERNEAINRRENRYLKSKTFLNTKANLSNEEEVDVEKKRIGSKETRHLSSRKENLAKSPPFLSQDWPEFKVTPNENIEMESFNQVNWNLPYFDPDIPLDCSETNPIILLEPLNQDIINAFKCQSLALI